MSAQSIDRPVLFHVGFHKTGTTWMQERVFVPQMGFRPLMSHQEVRELITGPNRLEFDPEPARSFISESTDGLRSDSGVQFVLSSELLCGNPFSGNRECADFAHRIAEIDVPTKILITVREQLSMITATYAQYVRRGGTLTIDQFLDRAPVGFEGFSPSVFCYDRVVSLYQRLIGKENICVVPREAILRDRLKELNHIRSFCGLEPLPELDARLETRVNTSTPEWLLPLDRRLNGFRRSAANPNPIVNIGRAASGLSKVGEVVMHRVGLRSEVSERSASAIVRDRFSDYFRPSNNRLQELVGPRYSFSDLGYRL